MYHNVRCFLLLGVLLCGAAVASLATARFRGWAPSLFALCILLGWLPWFLVTVYSLEKEDSERPTVFQPDDSCCARALKLLVIVVVAPLALAGFFLPYAVMAILRRLWSCLPTMHATYRLSTGLLEAVCCFYTYVLRPPVTCAWHSVIFVCERVIAPACRVRLHHMAFAARSHCGTHLA